MNGKMMMMITAAIATMEREQLLYEGNGTVRGYS